MKKTNILYNFGAGPACLPESVLEQIRNDIPNWHDGMSVMEISHRLPVFMEFTQEVEANFRQLLSIPEDFAVLFMAGGASTQFCAIPLNLLNKTTCADYLVTGRWSELAYLAAKKYCEPQLVASSEKEQYRHIPAQSEWTLSEKTAYFHYTDNETIQGVEFHQPPVVNNGAYLVTDMTSNILTKPINFAPYGLIYASAQKNLGISGITVIIVRKSLLGFAHPYTPATLNYALCEQNHSMTNTPPMFSWYVLGLVVKWALSQGGVPVLTALCEQRAKLLYDLIDNSDFYSNQVAKNCRSRINVPFNLPTTELESLFLNEANQYGLKQLKGHKVVGGCRASFYNAMPLEGVHALTDFMREFERSHG